MIRRINSHGFVPILIALGIISILGAMSLMNALTAGMINKRTISKLDRIEAFYANELSAWHGYLRSQEKLSPGEVL